METTADELKREIDRTREQLRADVEVLAEQLAPKQVARRGLDQTRERLREPRVQASLLALVGLLLLLRRRRRARSLSR